MLKVYHTKMINIKYTIILQPAARSFCLTFSNSCFIFEHKVNISYYIWVVTDTTQASQPIKGVF